MNAEINGLADYEIGFSKVIEEMINAKKPLIGHNMFLDIMFIYEQFIDDLPPYLPEFISKVRKLYFSQIIVLRMFPSDI